MSTYDSFIENPSGQASPSHWQFQWPLFARMLRSSRITRRLSLRDASEITGIAPATLLRMENGQAAHLDCVVAACEFMGLMVDAFVIRPGQPTGQFVEEEPREAE